MKFYFTSITDDDYLSYLIKNDCCNILISYLEKSKIKALLDKNLPNSDIFVDSGAFSAYTRNKKIDIDEYITFLNTYHDRFSLYASLDVIPDYTSFESVQQSSKDTWNNFVYMRERLTDKSKLLITFHLGEDYSVLRQILEYKDEFGPIKYLALGGLARASIEDRDTFIEKCYNIINSCGRNDIKIHLFGVTDMGLCEKFGADSVDSTTWIRAASFGEICTEFGRLVVSEARKYDDKHLLHKTEFIKDKCIKEMTELGFLLDDLMTSSKSRELYNILYFHNKSKLIQPPQFNRKITKCVELW